MDFFRGLGEIFVRFYTHVKLQVQNRVSTMRVTLCDHERSGGSILAIESHFKKRRFILQ